MMSNVTISCRGISLVTDHPTHSAAMKVILPIGSVGNPNSAIPNELLVSAASSAPSRKIRMRDLNSLFLGDCLVCVRKSGMNIARVITITPLSTAVF